MQRKRKEPRSGWSMPSLCGSQRSLVPVAVECMGRKKLFPTVEGWEQQMRYGLFTKTQLLNQRAVLGDIGTAQVSKHPLAAAYHDDEATVAGEILLVTVLHVVRDVVDALGKHGNLCFDRAGVLFITPVGVKQGNLLFSS